MIDQIWQVAHLRENLAKLQEVRKVSLALWEADNQGILDSLNEIQTSLAEAEIALRASAIAEYQATGNKAPAPGVAIRMMTRLTYEIGKAFEWAKEHKVALKLDAPTFEKIAKASPIDFVTISEEPQATIATDLKKAFPIWRCVLGLKRRKGGVYLRGLLPPVASAKLGI